MLDLEEQQIKLEKQLQEQKRHVMRQHLIKTIEENKVKMQEKRELLKQKKAEEQDVVKENHRLIKEDNERAKGEKLRKKYEMKNLMARQLQQARRKAEDQYELDRLAQVEADKRSQQFEAEQQFKEDLRKQLTKEAVLGNQDILAHKQWKRDMDMKQTRDALATVNENTEAWRQLQHREDLDKKQQRSV